MTETGQSSSPALLETPEQQRSERRSKKLIWVAAIFAVFMIATGFLPIYERLKKEYSPPVPPEVSLLNQRLETVEQSVKTLNARMNEISAQAGKGAGSEAAVQESAASAAALARMQGDLASLSSAIGSMQAEVKQASNAANQIKQAAQSSFASAIAFIQLRAAAEAGRGFTAELSSLRAAAPDDARLREILGRMDAYAAKGAPTFAALHEEYLTLEPSLAAAIDKSAAQNWWQRFLAAIKGLISIRPEHGGAVGVDAQIENALASGDLNAAVAATKNLPPQAQDTVKDWRAKAEARATIDESLHDLADRFLALAGEPLSSDTQAAP